MSAELDDLRDHHAERAIISIAVHGRTAEFLALPPAAFDHWIADSIARALRGILAKNAPVDAVVLARAIMAAEGTGARGQEVCAALAQIVTMGITDVAAEYYAERLMSLYVAREFAHQMHGFIGKMNYAAVNDDPVVAKRAFVEAREAIDIAEKRVIQVEETILSAQDFIDLPRTEHDWLVPDLFERTDRLILTGLEGTGKSFLLAQLACTVGAGLHPFTGDPLPDRPYTAMIVDCENSPRQIQRRLTSLASQVDALRKKWGMPPTNWREAVRVVNRPEGVAINDPREYARLDYQLDKVNPDIVVIGPLYKMSKLDYRDEQAAKEVCDTLDSLRVRHQFALVTEAHTGHAQDGSGQRSARPLGSSLFLRWPEFGLGLVPAEGQEGEEHPKVVNVRRWRGSREERNWPFQLQHGTELPWVPSDYYRAMVSTPTPSEW